MSSRFDQIRANLDEYLVKRDNSKRLTFERKIVRKLLSICGLDRKLVYLIYNDDIHDDDFLSFFWLHTRFPNLPFRFGGGHEIRTDDIGEFFFPHRVSSKFWSAWKSFKEATSDWNKDIGIALPASVKILRNDKAEVHTVVMHNVNLPFRVNNNVIELVAMEYTNANDERVTLELLDSFAARLNLIWSAT